MTSRIVGWREWVHLDALAPHDPIKAKIDTGARTSALHAWDVEADEVDGVPWLRFTLHPRQRDDDHAIRVGAPLVDWRDVRSSNGDRERRPVIRTDLRLGDWSGAVELSITNRDQMGFRMLIGRTALAGTAVVDPAASYLHGGSADRGPSR